MDLDIFWKFFGRSVSVRKLNEAYRVYIRHYYSCFLFKVTLIVRVVLIN